MAKTTSYNLLFLSLLSSFIQIFSMVVIIKLAFFYLNDEQLVSWFLMTAFLPFLVVFDANISVTLAREISFSKKLNDNYLRKSAFLFAANTIVKNIVYVLLFVALLIYLSFKILGIDFNLILLVFIIGLIGRIIANFSSGKLFALEFIKEERLLKITSSIFNLYILYLLLNEGYQLYSLGISMLIQSLYIYSLSEFIIRRKVTIKKFQKISKIYYDRVLIPSKEYVLIVVPGILILNSGLYFLKLFDFSNTILITYGISMQIFGAVTAFVSIIPSTFFPIISESYSKKDGCLTEKVSHIYSIYLSFSIVVLVNLLFWKNEILNLWLGADFTVDNLLFTLICIKFILEIIQMPLTSFCVAVGYIKFAKITAISSSLIILLSYPVIKYFGSYSLPILIIFIQLITCHQYNVRKFFTLFNLKIDFFTELIKQNIAIFVITILLLSVMENFYFLPIYKIVISGIISLLLFLVFNLSNLKRLTIWRRNG